MKSIDQIQRELAEPFEIGEVKWKPGSVKGNRAMVMAYVDARVVMDRLDDVFGPDNWKTEFVELDQGKSVRCRLSARFAPDGDWVWKEDVGGESEQEDEGDRRKAAHSDALKRAAVSFGIGRYLYRLPRQWVDYDTAKKQMAETPKLPPWAIPAQTPPPPKPNSAPPQNTGSNNGDQFTPPPNPQEAAIQKRVEAVLAALHSVGMTWVDPKARKRINEIIGREVPANAHCSTLTQAEADKVIAACKDAADKKAAKKAEKEQQKEQKAEASKLTYEQLLEAVHAERGRLKMTWPELRTKLKSIVKTKRSLDDVLHLNDMQEAEVAQVLAWLQKQGVPA